MKNKMITLDDEALLTAQQIGNFSAWVREQLHHYEEHGDVIRLVDYQKGIIARMWTAIQTECKLNPDITRQQWLHTVEQNKLWGED